MIQIGVCMEGPSIYALAEDLQPFKNKKIKKIYGNAQFEKDYLVYQTIKDIYSFGKRLIIQLDNVALITHFLMYGSYRIDEPRPDRVPRLAIETNTHKLFFYNCSTKIEKNKNIKKKLPLQFDILSDKWDVKQATKAMKTDPNQTIDDVLLDQEIFPGVGNIIKNEALFMSKILPWAQIKNLSTKQLKEIALNARTFSFHFLKWRKLFQKKNLLIYRKKECPVCRANVIRGKTGKRNRWSFWCPVCQH